MRRWFVGGLALIGAVSCALFLACVGLVVTDTYLDMHPTARHLEHILNWAEIGSQTRIVAIEGVCADMPILIQPDRVRVYKLKLAPFPLESVKFGKLNPWVRPPLTDPLLMQGISTAAMFATAEGCGWFPSAEDLNSERFYISFPQLEAFHGRVEGVELTALEVATFTLYHAEVRW